MVRAAVVGGAGYVGGELLRLLLGHPHVDVVQTTSDSSERGLVCDVHPNLRGVTDLRFVPHSGLARVDAVFIALPPGRAADMIDVLERRADVLIDLGSDFRLHDEREYALHYGGGHLRPDLLGRFVCGLPELYRGLLRGASRISTPGCIAVASILALHPLAEQGLVNEATIDARTGSSGSGSRPTAASHHADRSGVMRVYQPAGHRHEAEIAQAVGVRPRMTVSAFEAVRGVQVVAHVTPPHPVEVDDLSRIFRARFESEPFVRLVQQRRGLYRLPEPKVLSGSNFCDIGFAVDADGGRIVAISALDNLVKGAAGNAVQSFNIAHGFAEREALGFTGLHPV